jgi:hypothetical protein
MGSIFMPSTQLKELVFKTNDAFNILNSEKWVSAPKMLATWRFIRPSNVIAQYIQCSLITESGSARSLAPGEGLRAGLYSSPDGITWTAEFHIDWFDDTFSADSVSSDFGGNQLFDPATNYVGWGIGMDAGTTDGAICQQLDFYLSLLLPKAHGLVRLT